MITADLPPQVRPPRASGPSSPRVRAGRALRMGGVVLVGIMAVVGASLARRSPPAASTAIAAPVQPPTFTVDRGPLVAKVTATGTLSALVTVQVGTQVSGRIESIRVDFNSKVKKGQVIATLDPSLFRAAVDQARASYASAKANVDKARAQHLEAGRQHARAQRLLAQGLASTADFEAAEAQVKVTRAEVEAAEAAAAQARASLDQAELNLRYTTITSPISGVVISRNVDVGQTVAAALQAPTLFTIAQDLTKMQVDTDVSEADVGKVRAGMPVTFRVDAYPGRAFGGKVRQVRDAARSIHDAVTYDAVIDVDNSDRLLKPGMTATVTFVYDERKDALRVPEEALRKEGILSPGRPLGPDEQVLWLLRDEPPTPTVVRLGIHDGPFYEIVDGDVREGDRVILPSGARAPCPSR